MNQVADRIQKNFETLLNSGDFNWGISGVKFLVGNSIAHQTNLGGRRIYIETREGFDGTKWVVWMDGFTLGKDGTYHHEPNPSSRTDDYLELTRFDTKGAALIALRDYEKENRGEENK